MKRKDFLKWGAGALGAAAIGGIVGRQFLKVCQVRILKANKYDKDISKDIALAMKEDGLKLKSKSVLIKPNFVEFHSGHPINTNVKLLKNIVEACFIAGAAKVSIGEAAGHRRDPFFSLHKGDIRKEFPSNVPLIDMNHGDIAKMKNHGKFTDFKEFYVARAIAEADVIIDVPKLKTHHWVGVTLSLKNLFGTLPGIYYGWPKNLLHIKGIERSILDLSVSIPLHYSIIDGIVGMEGDGPIMGTPKNVGVVIMSKYPLAADVTGAEIMGFNPDKIVYLSSASLLHHGYSKKGREFVWESPDQFASNFSCLEKFKFMKK